MKNLKWLLAAVLFISFNIYTNAGEKKIKFKSLPEKAQTFYTLNFGKMKIQNIEYDRKDKTYEINLWGDHSIQFNEVGEWTEIDFDKHKPIPNSVIKSFPTMARIAFLKDYEGSIVTEIERNLTDMSHITYKIDLIDVKKRFPIEILLNYRGDIKILKD